MMKLPIYLDYMATTPVDPLVAAKMGDCLTYDGQFANPASSHVYGKQAAERIEQARVQVASLLHAAPREIIWTAGATEANNIALRGAAYARAEQGRHIITSQLEHKAVLDVCYALEKEGFRVTYLPASATGVVHPEQIAAALEPDTILVSIMHVNNEIGVINDINGIGQITRERGVWLHVDAAQSVGKLPINLMQMPIDLMSFSAHKIYGPKGMGALFVRLRPRVKLTPILFGGGQEQGLRPGTLATHQIVGMGEAFALASNLMAQDRKRIVALQQKLWNGIKHLPQIRLNGDIEQRIAGNLNICFDGLSKEILADKLRNLAISSGSACNAFNTDRSHVLRALGLTTKEIELSKRFSIGRFTSEQEIDYAITNIIEMYKT
jgi:cysteine desulfurase